MFVVFDLDGTLADNAHRLHHIRVAPKDYAAFYAACPDDRPCEPVIQTLRAHVLAGHRVEIWTGRSDYVRAETVAWLEQHGIAPRLLARMRPAVDHQPDTHLKRAWLQDARRVGNPDLAYDDRDGVVAMWREAGVTCFQVAPGDF